MADCNPQAARLTLREAHAAAVVPLLAGVARHDTTGGAETVEGMAAQGRCFVISEGGRDVGAYVLQRQGAECYVLAAAGAASVCLTDLLAELVEAQAIGLDSIAFQTRRRGLIRKALARGYRIDGRVQNGFILRKDLQQ